MVVVPTAFAFAGAPAGGIEYVVLGVNAGEICGSILADVNNATYTTNEWPGSSNAYPTNRPPDVVLFAESYSDETQILVGVPFAPSTSRQSIQAQNFIPCLITPKQYCGHGF